ncbi:MAG: hypothetical protein JW912_08485 [Sedimentisphaerales bacterium]|nr:hypothetical protein [Sedimentisphaerales bacterium]
MNKQNFIKISENFHIDADYVDAFKKIDLISIDAVFQFEGGQNLVKANLAKHRARIQFQLDGTTMFLKRYDRTPMFSQLKNWISHFSRSAAAEFDGKPCQMLTQDGIGTPKVIAWGSRWGKFFEKKSFIVTEKIPNAESLEKKLPYFFYQDSSKQNLRQRTDFINSLADFTRRFHRTGFRHRDFYLAHIFMNTQGEFFLIDLHRAFKPLPYRFRFRIKDIAQLYYSAPGKYITRSDRLRFYLRYRQRSKLSFLDKLFIWSVKTKAWRMADHDIKHGRDVPFAS